MTKCIEQMTTPKIMMTMMTGNERKDEITNNKLKIKRTNIDEVSFISVHDNDLDTLSDITIAKDDREKGTERTYP